uniref:Uncharacterized protein n=1 Tax=Phytophthora ramorum TaxID=164328 RepID=H3H4E3_PHYRM
MNPNSREWFFSAACARQEEPRSTPPRPGLQPDPVPQPSPARHPIPPAVASPSPSSSSSLSPSILDIYDGAPTADEPMTDAPPTPGQPAYRCCRGTNHELYGMMQRPPYYGSVVAKRVRDDVADPTMLKCLVYSKAAHVFKATLKPGRLDQPRKNKFLRLAEPYFGKLERAFIDQQATMGDVRTEIRFQVRNFGEIPAVFSRLFANVWGLLDVTEIDVRQVLRTQEATLEWARDNNLFVGRNELRVNRAQYAVFNILLNAFGVWNRFTRGALQPSQLMLTLRAKLILVGVRFSEVAGADQDEEMKEGNAGDDSDTEPEVDLTMDELDGNDSDTTETDFDNLFIDVMENVVVAQATNGGMLLVRDHMGVFVTRQRSREQVADVLIARYGAAWRDFVPHTQ